MSHIVGQLCRAFLHLILHLLQMAVIRDAGIGGDDPQGSADMVVRPKNRRADAHCVMDIFTPGYGDSAFADVRELVRQGSPADLREGLRAIQNVKLLFLTIWSLQLLRGHLSIIEKTTMFQNAIFH